MESFLVTDEEIKKENLIEKSFSELRSWRRCQKQHHYKYSLNLQKKSKSLPLFKGSTVHSCLESYYLGDDWKGAWKSFKKDFNRLMDEEKALYGDLPSEVARLMQGYIAYWDKLKNETWDVVQDKEGNPIVEKEFKLRIPQTRVVIKGVIDLIVEDEYGLWVVDHKTVKKDPPSDEFRMTDVQTTLYFWVVKQLAKEWGIPAKKIRGSIFNYIRTQPPKTPELLQSGEMSKRNIDTCWLFYRNELKKAGLDPKDYLDMKKKLQGNESKFYHRHRMDKPKALVKNLLMEVVHSAYQIEAFHDMPARTLDKSCDWMCDFKDLCYSDLQGQDTDFLIKKFYEERNGDGIEQRQKEKAKLKI